MKKFRGMTRGYTVFELLITIMLVLTFLVGMFFLVALMVWVGRHAFG